MMWLVFILGALGLLLFSIGIVQALRDRSPVRPIASYVVTAILLSCTGYFTLQGLALTWSTL